MSDFSAIETKVRYLIDDISTSGTDLFTYSTSTTFTLTESNIISVSSLYINDVLQGDSDWSYDSDEIKVTVSASLTSGDEVEIKYTYYPNYSTTEINGYIEAALVHLSACNYYTWRVVSNDIHPDPSGKDKNLIALITSLLINPDNVSYRMPDFSKIVPRDVSTIEKVRQAIAVAKHDTHGIFKILGT